MNNTNESSAAQMFFGMCFFLLVLLVWLVVTSLTGNYKNKVITPKQVAQLKDLCVDEKVQAWTKDTYEMLRRKDLTKLKYECDLDDRILKDKIEHGKQLMRLNEAVLKQRQEFKRAGF